MKPNDVVRAIYILFDRAQYILIDHLSDEERAAISVARRRTVFQKMIDPVPALLHPLHDIALLSGIPAGMVKRAIQAVLVKTYNTNSPCWKWSEDIWLKHASVAHYWWLLSGI